MSHIVTTAYAEEAAVPGPVPLLLVLGAQSRLTEAPGRRELPLHVPLDSAHVDHPWKVKLQLFVIALGLTVVLVRAHIHLDIYTP